MRVPIDPVSAEDLVRLRELDGARISLAVKHLDVELEKIDILAAAKRVKRELATLFERLAHERGIADSGTMEINIKTGEVAAETAKSVEPVVQQDVSTSQPAPVE
jgi:hypothetical protein